MASLRDPDTFDIYTYNDAAGYGVLETVQNLFRDFDEASTFSKGEDWKQSWAICEATAMYFLSGHADVMCM
jgi:hypothetical protein